MTFCRAEKSFSAALGILEAKLCRFISGVVRGLFLSHQLRQNYEGEKNTAGPARDLVDVALMYFLALNF